MVITLKFEAPSPSHILSRRSGIKYHSRIPLLVYKNSDYTTNSQVKCLLMFIKEKFMKRMVIFFVFWTISLSFLHITTLHADEFLQRNISLPLGFSIRTYAENIPDERFSGKRS